MKAVGLFALSATFAMCGLVGCDRDKRDDRTGIETPRTNDPRSNESPRVVNEPNRDTAVAEPATRNVNVVGSGAAASAAQSIAEARCARESRCNNVGNDKKYSNQDDCMRRVRADWKDELNARECPGGVVQDELNECLTEIRNEDCGNPFDTLGRLAACRSSDICKATTDVKTR
jgi:hypothetical protein